VPEKDYGVQHVVHISTNIGTGCEVCHNFRIGLDDLAKSVNHYIEKHGYKVFHLGSETSHDSEGHPWHSTVAVLGEMTR
jgi:hypothetical protein